MTMTPAERIEALQVEFARLKERQDYLDRMLQGDPDSWATLKAMIPEGTELVIDKAVTEARQGALAMATVAKTLAALTVGDGPPPAADPLDGLLQQMLDHEAKKNS